KEQLFNNQMWNRSGSDQNTIVELVPRYQKSFADDKGLGALELIYTSESLPNMDAIKLKPSVFYKITDKFSLNYALLLGREFKGGSNDYKFIESEPGFSYKIASDFGIGFNYFMKWGEALENDFSERERLAKPYIWKNFEEYKLGLSLWAEIGPYQNNDNETKNNNIKIGLSGNKEISEDLTLVGEISYKKEEKTKSNKNLYIPFYMLGVQYKF
ncbi:MAG: OmpG porin family protein, partial [Fusobacteriaceae bacterium]